YGSNGISETFYTSPFKKDEYDIEKYTTMLISASLEFELSLLGARKIGVFKLSPIGCVSLQRTVKGGIERDCVKIINERALIFNSKLSSSLVDLVNKLTDSRLVYLE
ncbi:hypothetical protein RYX36_025395, partial [Vicia faba]